MTPSAETYFQRQSLLPGWSPERQARLARARVLVVGLGGLGCPAVPSLAGAGVGHMTLLDPDTVSPHNLHRQLLFGPADVYISKVEAALPRLQAQFPHTRFDGLPVALRRDNALALVQEHDLVLDGTDSFAARYLANDACVLAHRPLVSASVLRFEGQLGVFNLPDGRGGHSPNLRDLFALPPLQQVDNCATAGVLGPVAATLATLAATEVLKVLTGLGEPLAGRWMLYDGLTGSFRTLHYAARPDNPLRGPYPPLGLQPHEDPECLQGLTLTYAQVKGWAEKGIPFRLIDVREASERSQGHLGGEHLPLAELLQREHPLEGQQDLIVVYCQHGYRSRLAAAHLGRLGHEVFSLQGGVAAAPGPLA